MKLSQKENFKILSNAPLSLASFISFTYGNLFQNGANDMPKMINTAKAPNLCSSEHRICSNTTSNGIKISTFLKKKGDMRLKLSNELKDLIFLYSQNSSSLTGVTG